MAEVTALRKKDIAKRWQLDEATIDNYVKNGVLTRMAIPSVRFSVAEVEKLEGVELNPLSPLERKRLEGDKERLEKENAFLKETLRETFSKVSGVI